MEKDSRLRRVPIVGLVDGQEGLDIWRHRDTPVRHFVAKPVVLDDLIQVMKSFGKYWLEIVEDEKPSGN